MGDGSKIHADEIMVGNSANHKTLDNIKFDNLLSKQVTYYPGGSPGVNADTVLDGSFLIKISEASGVPITGDFVYILQLFYNNITTTSPRTQIAFGYNRDGMAVRRYNSGWSNWKKVTLT